MTKVNIHPEHLRKSGGKLKDFGSKIEQAGGKLEQAGQNLVSHASGDRSGVGSVVAKFTGKATEITGKVFKEGGRVAGSAGGRLGNTADLYEEADDLGAKGLQKIHKGRDAKPVPGGDARSGSTVGSGGGKTKKAESVTGGGTRSGSRVGSGGKKDHEVPSLSGDLNDPPKSTRDYDSSGKTVPTDELKHPHQDLLDHDAIQRAKNMPETQRMSDALRPGVDSDHPVVKGITPDTYDPNGGLGDKGWEDRYWPGHEVNGRGERKLEWPDSQLHPEGFESPEGRTPSVLHPGTTIDRFGSGFGRFTSPPGTPFPDRGLPPESLTAGYHQYEVVRPIPVWEGSIAEAMGQPGGGTQYYMPTAVVDLVNAGYLREVKP